MKKLFALLLIITTGAQAQRKLSPIKMPAGVDSMWINGGNLFYRQYGQTKNAGAVGGTSAVTSVFGRTGVVTAQSGDYSAFYPLISGSYSNPTWITDLPFSKINSRPTTLSGYGIVPDGADYGMYYAPQSRNINGFNLASDITLTTTHIGEGLNLYFTNARSRASISLTTTGTGAGTYNNTTGVLNIPNYQSQINDLNTKYDSVKNVVIDSSYRANARVNAAGELVIKSDTIVSATGDITVTHEIDTVKKKATITFNRASVPLSALGGTLPLNKIDNITTQRLIGRNTAGSGVPEEITTSQALDWLGTTRGSVAIRGASGWVILPPGAAGTVIKSNGPGADPTYQTDNTGGGGSPITTTDNNLDITTDVLTMRKAPLTLTDGATITWNAANGYNARVVLGGNRTLDITNVQVGQFGTLTVVQDATGSRRLTVPNGTVILNPRPNDSTVIQWYYENGGFKWSAPEIGGIVYLPSNVANNNAVANTLQDVTDLSFPVYSGYLYEFEFVVKYNADATTTGSRWVVNGPASPTHLNVYSYYTLTATSQTTNFVSAYNAPSGSNASSLTTNNRAIIQGEIRPSANGTLQLRFACEVAGPTATITALATYSYVKWRIINQY